MDNSFSAGWATGKRLFVAGIIAVTCLGLFFEYRRAPAIYDSRQVYLGDPDDYMRLYRARQIVGGHAFLIRTIPLINFPDGAELHWTAPFDYLLAIPAVLFKSLVDHPDPVGLIACWLPPVLGCIYLAIMITFVRRLTDLPLALLAGLAVAMSPAFHRAFQLGHCDHQCAMELLFLVSIAGLCGPRSRGDGDPGRRAAIVSGIAIGMAIWIAIQSMAIWAALFAGLTFATFYVTPERRILWRDRRRDWSVAVLVVVVIGYLIENAPELTRMHADKISLLHVMIMSAVVFAPGGRVPGSRPRRFSMVAFCGLVLLVGLLTHLRRAHVFEYVSRPEFFSWSEGIMELQPLILRAGTTYSFAPLHRFLGFAPYLLPFALVLVIRSHRLSSAGKVSLAILATFTTLLTIMQRRWLDHTNCSLIPVLAVALWEAFELLQRRIPAFITKTRPWLAAIVFALLFFPSAVPILAAPYADPHIQLVRTTRVADQINQLEQADPAHADNPHAILTEEGEGPMFFDRTHLPITAVPYHRALSGIIEIARFFSDRDPRHARDQLDRLGVRYIVVPFRPNEQLINLERIAYGAPRSYDPSDFTIGEFGDLKQNFHYREGLSQTMIYRLSVLKGAGIPGLRLLAEAHEDPSHPDRLTGLLYLVEPERNQAK